MTAVAGGGEQVGVVGVGGDAEDGVLVREHVAEVARGGVVDEQLAVVAGREELARLAVPGECEDVAVVARVHGVR